MSIYLIDEAGIPRKNVVTQGPYPPGSIPSYENMELNVVEVEPHA